MVALSIFPVDLQFPCCLRHLVVFGMSSKSNYAAGGTVIIQRKARPVNKLEVASDRKMTSPKLDGSVGCLACLSLQGGEFDDNVYVLYSVAECGTRQSRQAYMRRLRYVGLQTKINPSPVIFLTMQAPIIYCG